MKTPKIILVSSILVVGAFSSQLVSDRVQAKTGTHQVVNQKQPLSLGDKYEKTLSQKNWQGTKVYDKNGNDLTKENQNFIGLAKYDNQTGFYEFFDKETGHTRGDEGTFFITNDGTKRILISSTQNYQAIADITELTSRKFTYKRMGVDNFGKPVEVFVDHIPYKNKNLKFTHGREKLNSQTGKIVKSEAGSQILSHTLWNGTVVRDEKGNDVTKENQNFISLAKFDVKTSKYEFFDINTGTPRGDFGYFDVIFKNKIRSHVSIGQNKYGAALELTELNSNKFTYKRIGKDASGKDLVVYVEHEPYKGTFLPEFTF